MRKPVPTVMHTTQRACWAVQRSAGAVCGVTVRIRCFIKALLHESSLARTMPIDRILTCRCDTTLVGRGRSSD